MIALAIFFGCVFAILALMSQSLRQARGLEPMNMDARSAIAMIALTNRLEEGPIPPEIVVAFESENPDYTVGGTVYEVETNGLFRIDFIVGGKTKGLSRRAVTMNSSILLYRPLSQKRGLGTRRLSP